MNKPLASIVIPCYNHEKYIGSCLNSVIGQTYENIEVLICDDCSTDKSFFEIKKIESILKSRFNRVVILQNEKNLGLVKNINKLIKLSNGEYIKILASDDMLLPNSIETSIDYLSINNDVDVLHTNAYIVNEMASLPVFSKDIIGIAHTKVVKYLFPLTVSSVLIKNGIVAPSVIIPKKTYEKYGLFDEKLYFEDKEYWVRVLAGKGKIGYLNKFTCYYRIVEGSVSHSNNDYNKEFKIYNCNKQIMLKYEPLLSRRIKTKFYNRMLYEYINKNNDKLVFIILEEMKREGYRIRYINRIMMNKKQYAK